MKALVRILRAYPRGCLHDKLEQEDEHLHLNRAIE